VATRREVDRVLRELVGRLEAAGSSAEAFSPGARSIACVITGLDVTYRAEWVDGRVRRLRLSRDGAAGADVRVSLASDDLVALAAGRASLAAALLTGRLRVDASPEDLALLRRLL
jgi:hypothetical protein